MADAPSVTVRCPSKLNLFLEVLGERPDGYHEIESVMVPLTIPFDLLEAALTDGPRVDLEVGFPPGVEMEIPAGDENLAARGARAILDHLGESRGVRLRLTKRIPPGAGLGGGSSDAAGALRAVNRLLGNPVPPVRLHALAGSLGSDVPFFLEGRSALARGRGERIEVIPDGGATRFGVLVPGVACPTADVYARCRVPAPEERRHPDRVLSALAVSDSENLERWCFNRLEDAARAVRPQVGTVLDTLRAAGFAAHLSGSGSACFFLARGRARCRLPDFPFPVTFWAE